MLKKKLVIGVAPTRRDFFSNDTVLSNRDKIMSHMKQYAEEYDFELVDIQGLSPDNTLSLLIDAEKIIEHFRSKGVNALFFPHTNFGMEEAVLKVARNLKLPTLIWGERDEAPNGFNPRTTDTQCGLFATGKALYRARIPFTYIENCFITEPTFRNGFKKFLATARIVNSVKALRIAQISVRPQPFLSVMINESELFERYEIELVPVSAPIILSEAKQLAYTKESEDIIQGYKASGIDISKLDNQYLHNMAGLEQAIWNFCMDNNCSAAVSECWFIFREALGIKPCAVFGNLADRGLPVGCENDVHGAISMLMASACNNYVEPCFLADLTQRHPTNNNAELLWHCGPFPKSLRKNQGHAFIEEGMGNWELKEGELTLLRFDGCRGEYKLLVGKAKTVNGPITSGNYVWAEVDDWPAWEEKIVTGPYIHHIAGVYGDYTSALKEACKYIPGLILDEA